MPAFEIIDHTADIGIRAFGRDEKTAFENAAAGMFSLITDLEDVEELNEYPIEVESEDRETLLVEWLNELLYVYESSEVLLRSFRITDMEETRLRGIALGEPVDRSRHRLKTDIKAATYYMLRVQQTQEDWQAEVIFDV